MSTQRPFGSIPPLCIATAAILASAATLPQLCPLIAATALVLLPHDWHISKNSLFTALFFLLTSALSVVLSKNVGSSLNMLWLAMPGLTLYLLLTGCRVDKQALSGIIWGALLAMLLLLGTFLIFWLTHLPEMATLYKRGHSSAPLYLTSLFENSILVVPNDIIMFSMATPLALTLWRAQPNYWGKLTLRTLALVGLAALLVLQSRSATLLILFALVATLIYAARHKALIGLATTVIILLSADYLMGAPLLNKFTSFQFTRLTIWRTAWAMFLDFPWTGMGALTFKQYYPIYLYKLGLSPSELVDPRTMPWAHNLYFEMLAERGIFGLLSLLALLANALWECRRLAKEHTETPRELVLATTLSLLIFVAAGMVELTFARVWVWLALGLLLGLINACHQLATPQNQGSLPPQANIKTPNTL